MGRRRGWGEWDENREGRGSGVGSGMKTGRGEGVGVGGGRRTGWGANSKHWFTTSFLQPLPYLVTP